MENYSRGRRENYNRSEDVRETQGERDMILRGDDLERGLEIGRDNFYTGQSLEYRK